MNKKQWTEAYRNFRTLWHKDMDTLRGTVYQQVYYSRWDEDPLKQLRSSRQWLVLSIREYQKIRRRLTNDHR
jgi:hypothetical protein